jgi:hypothetical protein
MTVLTIWPLFTTAFAFHCWRLLFKHTHHTSNIMRITSLASALALFLGAVTALDKPLDIQVTKAVECTRKAEKG